MHDAPVRAGLLLLLSSSGLALEARGPCARSGSDGARGEVAAALPFPDGGPTPIGARATADLLASVPVPYEGELVALLRAASQRDATQSVRFEENGFVVRLDAKRTLAFDPFRGQEMLVRSEVSVGENTGCHVRMQPTVDAGSAAAPSASVRWTADLVCHRPNGAYVGALVIATDVDAVRGVTPKLVVEGAPSAPLPREVASFAFQPKKAEFAVPPDAQAESIATLLRAAPTLELCVVDYEPDVRAIKLGRARATKVVDELTKRSVDEKRLRMVGRNRLHNAADPTDRIELIHAKGVRCE